MPKCKGDLEFEKKGKKAVYVCSDCGLKIDEKTFREWEDEDKDSQESQEGIRYEQTVRASKRDRLGLRGEEEN